MLTKLASILLATSLLASAATIASNTSTNATTSGFNFAAGQSVTTPAGGPWNNITFNLVDSSGGAFGIGFLYLLTQSYAGTPADLSSSTPGFVAISNAHSAGMWLFDPSVTLQGSTTYHFLMNSLLDQGQALRYSTLNPVPNANFYTAMGMQENYSAGSTLDAAFLLQGTAITSGAAVPEPASLVLLGLGLFTLAMRKR